METAREAIILAAMKGVRIYGLHGVRIRHISDLADVLPSSIYGYFSGKEDLMQACFDRVDDQLASLILTTAKELPLESDPEASRRRMWNRLFHWLLEHENETLFFYRFCEQPGTFLSEADKMRSYTAYASVLQDLEMCIEKQLLCWLHGFLGTVRYAKYIIEGVLKCTPGIENDIYLKITGA